MISDAALERDLQSVHRDFAAGGLRIRGGAAVTGFFVDEIEQPDDPSDPPQNVKLLRTAERIAPGAVIVDSGLGAWEIARRMVRDGAYAYTLRALASSCLLTSAGRRLLASTGACISYASA